MSTIHRVEPEPKRRRPSWQPVTFRRPGWETESRVWNGETPPDIPPRPTGSRLREKRWLALYGQNGAPEDVGSAQGSERGENGCY